MNQRGFTLIELLVVFGVFSLLASIAILRTGQQKDRAYRTTMVSDLRNVVALQEQYYSDNQDYANGITSGPSVNLPGNRGRVSFVPSGDNTIRVRRRRNGWNATAQNPNISSGPRTCGVFAGEARNAPNRNVRVEGVPACY